MARSSSTIPDDRARGYIDIQVSRYPATHAQYVAVEEWETIVRRLRNVDNPRKKRRCVCIDGESLDLKRELYDKMKEREAEIKEGKARKGNPVPLHKLIRYSSP